MGTRLLAGIEVKETAYLAFNIGLIAAFFEAARKQHFVQQPFFISGIHGVPSIHCHFKQPGFAPVMGAISGFAKRVRFAP
jgi:hypothetical protein